MTNVITEYWDADGTSLHTYAQAIETSGGTLRGAPTLRGTDVAVPYKPGESWVRKIPGSRVLSLQMWVRGVYPDGTEPTSAADKHALFNDNARALMNLLWRTDRQIALTKRWRTLAGGGAMLSATAMAEYAGGFDNLSVIDQYREGQAAKLTVDLKLADPYFYAPAFVTVGPTGSVTNIGDDIARQVKVVFSGAGHIDNAATGRVLTVGGACTVDVANFTAGSQLGSLTTTGDSNEVYWFSLLVGANVISGANISQLQYKPVYL